MAALRLLGLVGAAALAAGVATAPAAAAPDARAPGAKRQSVAHAPVADAHVSGARPRSAFGLAPALEVDSSSRTYALLRFPAVEGQVARATLSLAVVRGSRASFEIRGVSGEWDERSVTFRRAPAPDRASAPFGAPAAGRRVSVDVTPLVRAGQAVELAVLARRGAGRLAVASRESGTSAPSLTVELAAPPPPPAPPVNRYRGRVGVVTPTVWMEADAQLAMLRRVREAGVTWIREDFHWGAVERSRGVWNWEIPDRLMRSASLAGVDVLATIAYSAEWATTGPDGHTPPTNPAEYAVFAREVVNRYGAGGRFWAEHPELAPRPLQAVEIWNEPWLPAFWGGNPDPAEYVRLLRPAAEAVRAAHPEIKILASADIFYGKPGVTESLDWFRNLLPLDPALFRDLVDAYSVHAYSQNRGPRDTVAAQRWRYDRVLMTRDLAAAAGASHPIWVTELGWSTHAGHRDSVSEAEQAAYIRDALVRAVEEWGSFVERSFVYSFSRASDDYVGGYALMRPDGSTKPAWDAIASLLA